MQNITITRDIEFTHFKGFRNKRQKLSILPLMK